MARSMFLALSALLLCSACAVVGTSTGGSHTAMGVVGDSDGSTTDKIEFAIEQSDTPVEGRQFDVSVRFDMELKNTTSQPLRLRRISLESLGEGPVTIRPTRWSYDKTIAPGKSETIEFWAKGVAQDWHLASDAPIFTRSTVLFEEEDGEPTEALFTRRVNGRFFVAVRF